MYLVKPFWIALMASSLMICGVSKSGSPAEKERMSRPCALSSLAKELLFSYVVEYGVVLKTLLLISMSYSFSSYIPINAMLTTPFFALETIFIGYVLVFLNLKSFPP